MKDTHNYLRTAIPVLLLTVWFSLFPKACAQARENDPILIKRFHVSQEKFSQNGVLVSRPKAIDQRIVELIAANRISTLEDYAAWLKKNMLYAKDVDLDQWSTPESFLNTRTGDCEDYAFLTLAVARVLGYEPQLIALVHANGRGHAICVFQDNGYIVWFDNARLIKTPYRSFPEFARSMTQDFDYSRLLKLNTSTSRWQLVYNKP